jgi:hypothetical protein
VDIDAYPESEILDEIKSYWVCLWSESSISSWAASPWKREHKEACQRLVRVVDRLFDGKRRSSL